MYVTVVNCDPFGISYVCSYLICRYVCKKFSQLCKAAIGADFVTREFQSDDQLITLQVGFLDLLTCLSYRFYF